MAQANLTYRLGELPGDFWRDIGDLVGMHGLQKLWWTGSSALHNSLRRVLFRSLRGFLHKESVYKRNGHLPPQRIPDNSMCLHLQAQEVVVGPWPTASDNTKKRCLPQFFLASVMVASRSIRPAILEHVGSEIAEEDLDGLKSIPWLYLWARLKSLTLVAGSNFDPDVFGSHASALAVEMAYCPFVELLQSLPLMSLENGFGGLERLSIQLPPTTTSTLERIDISTAPSLVHFRLSFAKKSSFFFTTAFTVKIGPGLAHLSVHHTSPASSDIRKLTIEGSSTLRSLHLVTVDWPTLWDPNRPSAFASLESLNLESIDIPDAWSAQWPPHLKNLVLHDVRAETRYYLYREVENDDVSAAMGRRIQVLNPQNLPRALESLTVSSLVTVNPFVPDPEEFESCVRRYPLLPNPRDGAFQSHPIRLFLHESILPNGVLPCPKLKSLTILSGGTIWSMDFLPETLTSLKLWSGTGRLSEVPPVDLGLIGLSMDQHVVLMRAMSNRTAFFDQLESSAPLADYFPNLRSVVLKHALWTHFIPLERLERLEGANSWGPVVPPGVKITDLVLLFLLSAGELLYVPEPADASADELRIHCRRLTPRWKNWTSAMSWSIASLPTGIDSLMISCDSQTRLRGRTSHITGSGTFMAVWDPGAHRNYAGVLKPFAQVPLETINHNLVRLDLVGVRSFDLNELNLVKQTPSLRYLSITGFPYLAPVSRLLVPTLMEIELLIPFLDLGKNPHTDIPDDPGLRCPNLVLLAVPFQTPDSILRKLKLCIPTDAHIELPWVHGIPQCTRP